MEYDFLQAAALFDLAASAYGDFLQRFEWCWEPLGALGDECRRRLRGVRAGEIMSGAHVLGDDVDVGPGTVVEPGAVVKGPTVIGADCEIRAGAYIRGNVLVADGCVVGNSSEIKNALLLEGSHAPHFNYVGDSILGLRVNLGAGVKLSNYKIAADKHVVLTIQGRRFDTGLDKFGAVLGDDVEIGCNAVANPGTVVGPRTIIYAVSNVRGFVPADSVVKLRQPQDVVPRRGV
jgi:NDP-sugar pyrophosphorylase family protein